MSPRYIEREGKTPEEAMELALMELGVEREQVILKVLDEARRGILGLGARSARVRVTLKDDPLQSPEGILSTLLEKMGIEGTIHTETVDGNMQLSIVMRTFIISKGIAYYQVGGGLVADSDPEAEYQETLHKGQALRQALCG